MYTRRLEAVRQRFADARLQGLLLTSLPNIRYLTGFTGSNAIVLLLPDNVFFFTDGRYRTQASEEVHGIRKVIAPGSLFEALLKPIRKVAGHRIGFESAYLSVSAFRKLQRIADRTKFVPTEGLVEKSRVVKDVEEIEKIRCAAGVTDRVFFKILTILEPGIVELDVAAEITYWHKKFGAESDGFDPIVASGERGALPHARASSKKIRNREMVTIDMGCRVGGYNCDLTRTVSVGKPSSEMKKIYGIVYDAQKRTLEKVGTGVPARSLDSVARTAIRNGGYGKFFRHSTGHGLGLELHELPRISSRSRNVLEQGSVITVEPGIYVPQLGGVRIEDDIVVGEKDGKVLSGIQKELLIV